MARPLRIQYAGACYHVMDRGNRRAEVFHTGQDYELFLTRLGRFAGEFDVRVHCYCLMPNHFHLYLRTEQANLSRFMQSFLTSFTLTVNRVRKAPGHVFQGRFRSQLVEDDRYRSAISRYIHLNPVRVERLREAPVAARREELRMHPWSSYPACIGLRQPAEWLDIAGVLSAWGESRAEAMKAYRRYVEEGLVRDLKSPFSDAAEQSVLGSEPFVDRIRRRFVLARQAPAPKRSRQRSLSLTEVARAVAAVCGGDPRELLSRDGGHRIGRGLLMHCAAKHCRSDRSLSDLAEEFDVSVSAMSVTRTRFVRRLAKDPALGALVDQVEALIIGVRH